MKEYIIILILLSLIFIISVYGLSKKKIEGFTEGTQGSSFVSRIPKGLISAFYGSQTDLQNVLSQGWALCDGTNNTPNLSGRFILGAGQGSGLTNRTSGETGGVETHSLSTAEMPPHSHGIFFNNSSGGCPGNYSPSQSPPNGPGDACGNPNNGGAPYPTTSNGGDPNSPKVHDPAYRSDGAYGSSPLYNIPTVAAPHENMPPYYVLAYIMKL